MRPLGKRLPDILIGLLIVVLAVGLGSLLLTQRNRAAAPAPSLAPTATIPAAPGMSTPSGTANNTAPVQTPTQPAVTSPPVVQPDTTQPDTTQPPTATNTAPTDTVQTSPVQTTTAPPSTAPSNTTPPTGQTQANTQTPPASTTPTNTAPTSTAPSENGPAVTAPVEAPTTPKVDTSKPPVVTTHSPVQRIPVQPPSSPPETLPSEAAPSQSTQAAPRRQGAVATSENRVPLRRDYRISLGVFSSRAEVQRQTATVSALGYTVYPIDLGDRVVAQVGPFADAASAQQASQDIARAYSGATVLAPRNAPAASTRTQVGSNQTSNSQASSDQTTQAPRASTTPSPSAPQTATPITQSSDTNTTNLDWQAPASAAPETPDSAASTTAPDKTARSDSAPRPAPSGPVYLQVGAFDRPESAQTMVSQLKDLGYEPSVQAPEGKKVTVLIGPFRGDALLRTETRLDNNGFDHFRVR